MTPKKPNDTMPKVSSPTWSYISAITLGLLSSSCCVIQLILNAFSIGCAGFSVLTPFRPIFGTISLCLIAFTIYKYRLSKRTAVTLGIALVLSASPEMVAVHNQSTLQPQVGSFNSITTLRPLIDLFHKTRWNGAQQHQTYQEQAIVVDNKNNKQPIETPLVKYDIHIEGMACEACASRLRQYFTSQPGIADAKVFFDEKRMEIWSKFGSSSLMLSERNIQDMVAQVDLKYSARIISIYSSSESE